MAGGGVPESRAIPVGQFGPDRGVVWERSDRRVTLRFWEPGRVQVVLGRGSRLEQEVVVEQVLAEGVPVTRRSGGGCAVVVGPGVLVLSCTLAEYRRAYPVDLMEEMSEAVAAALGKAGVAGLVVQRGGDVSLGDRKIMGACLYVGADRALYGSSLLVNPDISLMDRFLKHPPREPEYRRGRRHLDFVTSLWNEGYHFEVPTLARFLGETLWEAWTRGQG